MKRAFGPIISMIIMMVILVGCSAKYLPDWITEEMLVSEATEVISVLSSRDYAAVIEMYREDLKSELTTELLSDAMDGKFDELGAFVRCKNAIVGSDTDMDTNDVTVFCIVFGEYENGSLLYRIVFDDSMILVGLFNM